MARFWAVIFGIVFICAGVAGYDVMPQLIQNDLLFGYFQIDTMHNVVNIVIGVIAILCASSARLSKTFFILFGLLFAVVAGLFFYQGGDLYGVIQFNAAENFLHVAMAVIFLIIGVSARTK